jgi:hypothetical protein
MAVGRPRAAGLGRVVWCVLKRSLYWRYRRLQGESTMLLCELTFLREKWRSQLAEPSFRAQVT